MELKKLQELYNLINGYSVVIEEEVDFSYIQTSISKTAIYIQEINKIIAEIFLYENCSLSFDSSCRFRSIITNRNRTIIAPA